MLFNSLSYILFILIAFVVFSLIKRRFYLITALLFSLFFYGMWSPVYLIMIVFSATCDYLIAKLMLNFSRGARTRFFLLSLSIFINISVLIVFKYYDFFLGSVSNLLNVFGVNFISHSLGLILPLGISFYTFLAISYVVDVYRGLVAAENNYTRYLLYVFFWPHMIAGPILRPAELLQKLNFLKINLGIPMFKSFHLIIVGLFLKVVLGDQIGPGVDEAFLVKPNLLSGLDVFTMAYSFGLQIYFDFAGYSLIAIGSAQLFGVKFPYNFYWPYLAANPRNFWRRWHITLSSWIRDYLYLPLQGVTVKPSSLGGIDHISNYNHKRTHAFRVFLALFLTWVLMGLWHGANWQFAFWGIWHALLIVIFKAFKLTQVNGSLSYLSSFLGNMFTIPLIMLGWIFFRSPSPEAALSIFSNLFSLNLFKISLAFEENFYLIIFVLYVAMLICYFFEKFCFNSIFKRPIHKIIFLSFIDMLLIPPIIMFWGGERQFIYFQF